MSAGMSAATQVAQEASRIAGRAASRPPQSPASAATQAKAPIIPTWTGPPIHAIAPSTIRVCSHAGSQSTGPSQPRSSGMGTPARHFGYATTSVSVESGVHRSVSTTLAGCIDPKWKRTTGRLARNAASPAAIAREPNSQAIATAIGLRCRPSSLGIQPSQRARIAGAR